MGRLRRLRRFHGATVVVVVVLEAAARDAFVESGVAGLIDEQHCMFCHTTQGANLAPSLPKIAERYRKVQGAGATLAQNWRVDGKAHWGDITMPDADRVASLSPEQADLVVLLRHRRPLPL